MDTVFPLTGPKDGEVTADLRITPAEDIVDGICLMRTPFPGIGGKNDGGFTFLMYWVDFFTSIKRSIDFFSTSSFNWWTLFSKMHPFVLGGISFPVLKRYNRQIEL